MNKGQNSMRSVLGHTQGPAKRALAKAIVREQGATGRLVTHIRSRLMLIVWLAGIALAAFICFTVANTVGRSLLGLEQSLEHHQGYQQDPFSLPRRSEEPAIER